MRPCPVKQGHWWRPLAHGAGEATRVVLPTAVLCLSWLERALEDLWGMRREGARWREWERQRGLVLGDWDAPPQIRAGVW